MNGRVLHLTSFIVGEADEKEDVWLNREGGESFFLLFYLFYFVVCLCAGADGQQISAIGW